MDSISQRRKRCINRNYKFFQSGDNAVSIRECFAISNRQQWNSDHGLDICSGIRSVCVSPVASTTSNLVYFSALDNKNYAVNLANGTIATGWPTAVFSSPNIANLTIDATTGSVYFGGGDGYLYRYPR